MGYVLFDCSQFISFDLKDHEYKIDSLTENFTQLGFKIMFSEKIESKKINYLKEYFSEHVIELFDQEFISEFKEWVTRETIPEKIVSFGNALEKLMECSVMTNLKVILVDTAPLDKFETKVVMKELSLDTIFDGLFNASSRVFAGNIIVFSISSSD